MIYIDNEQLAILITANPTFIPVIEAFEVINADAALVIAPPHLDVFYQSGNACPQVDQQVGGLDGGYNGLKKGEVIFKIAALHQTHICQIRRKDVGILINGAILYHRSAALLYLLHLTIATGQKKYLQIERPPLHVHIKIGQIRVAFRILIMYFPTKMAC